MKFQLAATFIFLAVTSVFSQNVRLESLLINGQIPVYCNRSDLEKTFRIDSVVALDIYENSTLSDSVIYIGETDFDYFSGNNTQSRGLETDCVLRSVVFDEQVTTFNIGIFEITGSTTIADIARLFPEFCADPQPISVYGDPRPHLVCAIDTDTEYRILVFFREGKVVMLHLWQAD
ncbi:hypothetical protein [Fulvivirga sedimenti]|uniref:Uncharacterized protein n=1 Tax=Fulvivirga sedimenti TaxID=2879465 RepID=A0A9X1KZW8_9BACT|nr:hypothetical protein [Fulvivirga sedimenti]MCA6075460.1 hypothetical protein [Fulvivirga sedimenti]MCA6076637.1 hypothetical protein [Fulvivirga sedimenti]MCA6077765.1 hypothetical protein [Fulvivirga sedimenti]